MSDVKIKELDKSLIHQANNNSMSGKRGDISAHEYEVYCQKVMSWNIPDSRKQKIVDQIYTRWSEQLRHEAAHVSVAVAGPARYNAKKLDHSDTILRLSSEFVEWFNSLQEQVWQGRIEDKDAKEIARLVDNILYDALTKSFIRDSHASQTGKGTDDGLMRLKTHMVDYYRREGHGADGWVLKGDVRHFFASIDHRKLKRKLKAVLDKRGVDPRVYELLCIYIDVMEDGLPLGYQTSQLFALMFLDEFDHIIKEKYRIKYYGRYMDDFYIICSDKRKLQCILRDVRALMDSYGLELNQKTAIFPLRNGIDFLGFHSYLTDTGAVIQKLRRDSSKRMKNKIKYWETAYPAGEVTKQEILRSFDAWDAHAAHGETYSLRRKYADRLEKLLDCKIPIHRKINSNKLARDRRRARQCRCIYKKQHKALSLSVSQNTRPAGILPWA